MWNVTNRHIVVQAIALDLSSRNTAVREFMCKGFCCRSRTERTDDII
jgi:hypothetical protein